jgi:hypothetical protein
MGVMGVMEGQLGKGEWGKSVGIDSIGKDWPHRIALHGIGG